jgi:hypothetical protein
MAENGTWQGIIKSRSVLRAYVRIITIDHPVLLVGLRSAARFQSRGLRVRTSITQTASCQATER